MAKRRARDLDRRSKPLVDERQEYVLIVCEGRKTEPNYFEELQEEYQLGIVNIDIIPADEGTDPMSVVRTAESRQDSKKKTRKRPFDRVYCVFDRDEHGNFDDASRQITALQGQGFRSARSWPCFEFWLLLHFGYTRKSFERGGGRSACQNCEKELQSKMKDYRKGKTGVFGELFPRLEKAKGHAASAMEDAKSIGEENPFTEIHELVGYLQDLNGMKSACLY
uniref:RloB-like protein n=1 Tax=Candidatus Kentrum sp. LFY TaxID=2126342 RepID=A0A450UVN2_9GAMM|nr:MAG: RloB-like protein [Candidatus Kentron sp. LFY]